MNITNNPQTTSKHPINETGKGATKAQKEPKNKDNIENIKANILKLNFHKTKDKGPDKITLKNIIATINAKDSILVL